MTHTDPQPAAPGPGPAVPGSEPAAPGREAFNPWSVVNLVFHHLAAAGLHPVLGEAGDPGRPAADLLRALGITPAAEGSPQQAERKQDELARLREAVFGGD